MKDILVSICCLTYNHEKYIRQCIESFLLQETNFSFEILIHDDASKDGTVNIIREYEKNYPDLIKPIYQSVNQYSQGVRPSFKYNFPRAKGKYIAMCEGDDYWTDPKKLQKQVDFLEKNTEYVLCGHHVGRDIDGEIKFPTALHFKSFDQSEICINHIPTLSAVFKNKIKHYPEDISTIPYGDFFMWVTLGAYGKFAILPEIMANYRVHEAGMWSGESQIMRLKNSIKSRTVAAKYISESKDLTFKDIKKRAKKGLKLAIKSTKVNDAFFFLKVLFASKHG
ncbi:glycosyltransferase [Pedobacter sp. Du54]|uniref:glycosyltransferase family 2 protein n=1 Tax=Pedobacter anseongensis TaxID=3133439 RepID=UPI00309D4C98